MAHKELLNQSSACACAGEAENGCCSGHAHGGHEKDHAFEEDDGCGCEHDHTHHENKKDHACAEDDGCGCGHDHGVMPEKSKLIAGILRIVCGISLLIGAEFLQVLGIPQPLLKYLQLFIFIGAYLLVGYEVVWTALKNITKGRVFDENFLMTVATLGAFAVGDYAEAVAVMIFYGIGETLQGIAVAKSRANIATLMNIRPEFARVVRHGAESEISPEAVAVGEVIIIRPGERIPLDCTVTDGTAAVDASALTGESVPIAATTGAHLASGSVNLNGVLTCTVDTLFAQSTVQKILSLVSDASAKKAKAEKFITRFSKIYTPCVMAAAALIAIVPPLFLGMDTFSQWFYRGLIFLVVSCPCALVISVPVSFLGGIGGAAKNGVLVKGGDVIDLLAMPKALVMDKTGTLTQGKFAVQTAQPAAGVSTEALLAAIALCERSSKHPIALSVRNYCGEQDSGAEILAYEEKAGHGVLATTQAGRYAAGNEKMMAFVKATLPTGARDANDIGTVLHVALNSAYLGTLRIADEIKPDAAKAIATLRTLGVEQCYMLTGDNEAVAQSVAKAVGLDGYKAGLLPHEKVAAYEALTKDLQGVSMYAGDGINDAPLLARADVGIAMGWVGSDAAIEAADVVLMTDELGKIAQAVKVARQTRAIVKQNIVFALGVKLVVLVVAAMGYTPMWLAIFADVGVALIAIANAARAVRFHG